MTTPMRIVLIGNYPPDKQESMERFAQMMQTGFRNLGVTAEIWRPVVFFAKGASNTTVGLGKWLGYLDKWILFPLLLRWRLRAGHDTVRFHICDHSNAPYLGHLPYERTGITCHDVLAIRGAMGFDDAYCPASGFGKILQKWILGHLSRAKLLATVSKLTLKQLTELAPGHPTPQQDWRVIHNAFNGHFWPMPEDEARELLHQKGIRLPEPFILHVGSGMTRKNRRMLLDMAAKAGSQWTGTICYAGHALEDELTQLANSYGLADRVVSVTQPDHNTLVALYSLCQAFVFPSFSEGFGWPLIEAQACGAPVITSTIEPMPEVSGGAALYASPSEPIAFAEALLALQNETTRAEFIRWGFDNAANFESDRIMNAYLDIHTLAPVTVH
ncbi:glycosyl transferase group 1 [Spirosoma linguale DSM 74]|uniref:Glycosyl transferase group 1 n=2 Tax=Spirosoma TaxID=107 RepID=D2QTX6_SPILD|nr:glycosyl transferase group 1 [Spirosoma linguale DSM 74]